MLKSGSILLLSIVGSALAAPAVVWKKGTKRINVGLRTSESLKASDLLADVLREHTAESSLTSVVFLLGRGEDGTESLSSLAAAGALPNVEAKYNHADAIHHHVSGVESPDTVVRDASHASAGQKVLQVSLGELMSKLSLPSKVADEVEIGQNGLMSKTQKFNHKRTQDLSNASVLIVTVETRADSEALDKAIVDSIEHESIANVVLTAVRSHDEVKHERLQEHRRRLHMMKDVKPSKVHSGRRRLEDQQQEGGENNNNAEEQAADMSGVYYVNMTPNILAGILFTLLFAVIAYTGVTCMGMISGQDVYVSKMPPVGREA